MNTEAITALKDYVGQLSAAIAEIEQRRSMHQAGEARCVQEMGTLLSKRDRLEDTIRLLEGLPAYKSSVVPY